MSGVQITATGSAGETVNGGEAPGGSGDVVSGTLSGVGFGQVLDVCVDYGGGSGGPGDGGTGGGASGVALGGDFSVPVLIAGGGGGGAISVEGGGSAGRPGGSAGDPGNPCTGKACGGGGGTQMTFGGGGAVDPVCSDCMVGANGAGSTSAGPGAGGAGGAGDLGGGGGGGGYYGAGGGGGSMDLAGGGGGGSDFCASTLTGASLRGCRPTGTNSTFGTASVVLTFTQAAWAHDFRDLLVDSQGVGPGETLVHKVKLARSKYMSGDVSGSCRSLDGYIREVNKQTGATIARAQARDLIEDAHETQKAIGCSSH